LLFFQRVIGSCMVFFPDVCTTFNVFQSWLMTMPLAAKRDAIKIESHFICLLMVSKNVHIIIHIYNIHVYYIYSIIYNVNAWKTDHSFPVHIYQILLEILICILYFIKLAIIFFLILNPFNLMTKKLSILFMSDKYS